MASLCPRKVATLKPEGGFVHISTSSLRDYSVNYLRVNSLRISQEIGVKQKSGFPDSVTFIQVRS